MHDIRFIRETPEAFDAGLKKRGLAPLSAEILDIGERTLYRKLKEYHVPDRFGE